MAREFAFGLTAIVLCLLCGPGRAAPAPFSPTDGNNHTLTITEADDESIASVSYSTNDGAAIIVPKSPIRNGFTISPLIFAPGCMSIDTDTLCFVVDPDGFPDSLGFTSGAFDDSPAETETGVAIDPSGKLVTTIHIISPAECAGRAQLAQFSGSTCSVDIPEPSDAASILTALLLMILGRFRRKHRKTMVALMDLS